MKTRESRQTKGSLRALRRAWARTASRVATLITCSLGGRALGAEASFDAGNQLLEQGKPLEAMAVYSQLWTNGQASVALHFNWGCAALRAGELGQAMWQFHRARRWAPRDHEVTAHLDHVRQLVAGGPEAPLTNRRAGQVRWLSLGERAAGLVAGIWLTFLCLAAMQFWPGARQRLRWPFRFGLGLVCIFLPSFATAWYREIGSRPAVVTKAKVEVRLAPFPESQVAFQLSDGAEIWVDAEKGAWWRIRDAMRRQGWVNAGTARRFNDSPTTPTTGAR